MRNSNSLAILGGLGIDNLIDSGLDVLRWIDMTVDIGIPKMQLVAIVSGGVGRALGSVGKMRGNRNRGREGALTKVGN